ncbi:hypothetical protein BGZ76_005216, partial [Entomortierella beljakovae]
MSIMEADVIDRSVITSSILTEKFRANARNPNLQTSGRRVKSMRTTKVEKQCMEDYQLENVEDGDSAGIEGSGF